ncbi:hypothetical protein KAI78_02170 [bacterium]|nr:hypothetical protein [bacterium]
MNEVDVAAAGLAAGTVAFSWLLSIVLYVYMALVLQTIAKKTNTENAWFAWIPILNLVLMIMIAQKPMWWIAMIIFVPIANIVFGIMVWIEILKRRNYPPIWFLLFLIPIVNLIILGVIAWKDREEVLVAAE